MTTSETRSSSVLTTSDHKILGLVTLGVSLLFLLAASGLELLLRLELTDDGVQMVGNDFWRILSMHDTFLLGVFLIPVWLGLGTYLVPLQIGAPRLAFPRLHAFATWLFAGGAGLLVASYIVGPPAGGGLSLPVAVTRAVKDGATATDLWIVSLGLIALALLLQAVDLVVTACTMRAPGVTLPRLPMFTWGITVYGSVLVLVMPVLLAGLLLLYLDAHFGGSLLTGPGGEAVYQHALWSLGRPETIAMIIPALAAGCELIAAQTRRPFGRLEFTAARAALVVIAVLSFGVWASGITRVVAVVLPTSSALTALVALPVGVIVLTWLSVFRSPSIKLQSTLTHVLGFLVLAGLGAGVAALAGFKHVAGGTLWTEGFIGLAVVGAPTLLVFGAVHHWAPRFMGRPTNPAMIVGEALLLTAGFALNGMASIALGYKEVPAFVKDPQVDGVAAIAALASVGAALVLAGVGVFVLNMLLTLQKANSGEAADHNPWPGDTLEWAAPWPPLAHNFSEVPEVHSAHPLADARVGSDA